MPRPAARPRPTRRLRPLLATMAAAAALAWAGPRPGSAGGVAFDAVADDGLEEVLAKAKGLGASRLVVVELFTARCAWCRVLERETFGADDVAAALRDDLCVRLDAEGWKGLPVAERFHVRSYPTILFLDPAGEEVDRLVGFVPVRRFVEETVRVRAGTATLKALRAAHAARPADAALSMALAHKLVHAGDTEAARLLVAPVVGAQPPDPAVLPTALLALAELAHREGDARLVEESLDRLLGEFPEAPEAADGWLLRIDRLVAIGAYDRAAQAAVEARRRIQGDGRLALLEERLAGFERLALEATVVRWGERADAAGDLESLARAAKTALERRVALGTALRWAERLVKAAPEDLDASEVRAELLFETGRTEKAIAVAAAALDVATDDDDRARLSRRLAAWRATLGGAPRPSPAAADPDAVPLPSADRVPPPPTPSPQPLAPGTRSSPVNPSPSPEPKPPCR